MCVCVCVICTYRGGSLCSAGQDAPFGSGLLRPLWNVGPSPSAVCVCVCVVKPNYGELSEGVGGTFGRRTLSGVVCVWGGVHVFLGTHAF